MQQCFAAHALQGSHAQKSSSLDGVFVHDVFGDDCVFVHALGTNDPVQASWLPLMDPQLGIALDLQRFDSACAVSFLHCYRQV